MVSKGVVQFPPGRATVPPDPPPALGAAGSDLWREILEHWEIDPAGLVVLGEACHARDTAERLRRKIEATGDEITSARGGTKANPLIVIELHARALTARLLARLGLLDDDRKRGPGRPPKGPGNW